MILLLIVLWLGCGILDYGFWNGYMIHTHGGPLSPVVRIIGIVMIPLGPFTCIGSLVSGASYRYGWKW